jgi:hypothetical protein
MPAQHDILEGCHLTEDLQVLKGSAQAPASHFVGADRPEVDIVEDDPAGARREEARYHIAERRLT